MNRLIIILVILFFMIVKLYSQSDFRNGYIIKNNNDTIYGLIDYRGNKSNAKKCIYKKDVNSEKQEFTPTDLKAYRFIDSKYYISRPVKSEGKENPIFLEYLINGIVDILYYRDEQGEHYLADMGDDKLYELKNEDKEVYVNYKRFTKESKEYIGILKYLFSKSPSIAQRVDNIALDHKSLIKIAHDYHTAICSDKECIIYEKKPSKIITSFGPLIGLNAISISELSSFQDKLYYLNNSHFKNVIYPSIGMFYKIGMPDLNDKLYFQYEGSYSHVKLTTTNSDIEPIYFMDYINYIKMTLNSLCNSGLVRYEFPKGKIRPTFQIGGFVNYSFLVDYTRNLDVKFSSGATYYTDETHDNPFSRFDLGISLGLGIVTEMSNKKEISMNLRYQRGFGLIQGLNSNYLLLNFGFQIGK